MGGLPQRRSESSLKRAGQKPLEISVRLRIAVVAPPEVSSWASRGTLTANHSDVVRFWHSRLASASR